MKAIIVGGGIMGLCTGWSLARSGHEVELFEQGPLPNPLASSMDEHRLIRHPYGNYLAYARMIDDALAAWGVLWRDLGQSLYRRTGTLALTSNGADWAQRSAAVLASIGRMMIEVKSTELKRRFPMLNSRSVEHAFWIESGGVLFAQDIVAALIRHLSNAPNVRIHSGATICAADLERASITTESGAKYGGDVVVVAAGAWVGRLAPELALRLVPSRQVVAYFRLPDEARAVWSRSPMILDKTGDVGLYLVPPIEGRGLKIGDHEFSRRGDPAADRNSNEDEIRPLLERGRSLLVGFDRWQIDRLKVCFYTVTDDERFVVERRGGKGWVMSACSGHGFKFAALMGRELARTIASGGDANAHARWAAGLEGDTR